MFVIDSVLIEGIWGDQSLRFDVKLDKEVNILIGKNGTGKTTIIKLIAAALDVDIKSLSAVDFKKITIGLCSAKSRIKPTISIIKSPQIIKSESSYELEVDCIKYIIKEKASEASKEYIIPVGERAYYIERRNFFKAEQAREIINRLISRCWLTVHRYKSMTRNERNQEVSSPIDKKIEQINERLFKFFSLLETREKNEKDKFIQKMFLLLLNVHTQDFYHNFASTVNLKDKEIELEDIFSAFKVSSTEYKNNMDKFFKKASTAVEKWCNSKSITIDEASSMWATWRIISILEEWKIYVRNTEKIFYAKSKFISILNGLFDNKNVIINESKEICELTPNNKCVYPKDFSSGEKQALIILSEALLQDGKPYVFIADEPELSLHVEWQESLIHSIKTINPNVQVIFATHSPDIASNYNSTRFIIKMGN